MKIARCPYSEEAALRPIAIVCLLLALPGYMLQFLMIWPSCPGWILNLAWPATWIPIILLLISSLIGLRLSNINRAFGR